MWKGIVSIAESGFSSMEKLLLKLAEQLDALDEASLMALWNKYAKITCTFEPTRRWETAALVFCLIQAKHMKNQLFNHHWTGAQMPGEDGMPAFAESAGMPGDGQGLEGEAEEPAARQCRILSFPGGGGPKEGE